MSVQVYRFLVCNGRSGCGSDTTKIDKEGEFETCESNAILRGLSKGKGWHSTGDYDLCPNCYEHFFGKGERK